MPVDASLASPPIRPRQDITHMHVPPTDPRHRPSPPDPSWSDLAISYLLIPAVPVLLWAVSNPWYSVAVLVGVVGLRVAVRRLAIRLRHLAEQRTVKIQVGRSLRITITDVAADVCRPMGDCRDEGGSMTCR